MEKISYSPGQQLADAADHAWNLYKWQEDMMLHGTTFKQGFYAGNDYGVKRVLKLVAENVSPEVANDIESLLRNQ